MKDLKRIKKILKKELPYIKEKYKIKGLGVFGSYVRGENKKGSDIDILVEFKKNAHISLLDFIDLENYLTDILGIKVDLVEKSCLKPYIGKNILKEMQLL